MRSFRHARAGNTDAANVICLGDRVSGPGLALESIHRFLASELSGAERHRRRLGTILALEAAFGAPQGD